MGLDIYAGPLTRYYAGDWQTIIQRIGAEQGMEVHVVRPGDPLPKTQPMGPIGRILTKLGLRSDPPADAPERPDNAEVQELVTAWRDTIVNSLRPHMPGAKPWNESMEADYDTDKPDWDGLGAVILWAAYAECSDLSPPTEPGRDWQDDPAFARMANENGGERFNALLRNCEVWLPLDIPGTFEGPLPNEHVVAFGSVPALRRQLESLNESTWNIELNGDVQTAFDSLPAPRDAFEETARFGFAILYRLTRFADENETPMLLDY